MLVGGGVVGVLVGGIVVTVGSVATGIGVEVGDGAGVEVDVAVGTGVGVGVGGSDDVSHAMINAAIRDRDTKDAGYRTVRKCLDMRFGMRFIRIMQCRNIRIISAICALDYCTGYDQIGL